MGENNFWLALLSKLIDKFPFERKKSVPKETIRLVLHPRGTWWHMGSVNKKPAMQVVCHWHVTNITHGQVIITAAYIKKPRTEASLPLLKHPTKNVYGSYPILSGKTSMMSLDFWVNPPVRKKGESFKADIVVKDQFGNEHKAKEVEFDYR